MHHHGHRCGMPHTLTDSVLAVAIAPDSTWLATAGADGTVRIWDPVIGARVGSSRVAGPLAHLGWSGETLLAAGAFGPYIFRFVVGQTTR
jgi:WD40 repeat protein